MRSARPCLNYCLTLEARSSTWIPHPTPRVIARVQKRPGVLLETLRPTTTATWVGTAERQQVAERLLEPVAAGLRPVEDARVGALEPTEAEPVAVASLAVVAVNAEGSTRCQRRKKLQTSRADRRAQTAANASPFEQERKPSSSGVKPIPACSACRFAHSCPCRRSQSG